MRQTSLAAAVLIVLFSASIVAAQATGPWQQPAAALASKIADLIGPGQAHLTLTNLSSISADDLAKIQKLLSDDLHARGVTPGGSDSANSVHITLSESATELLWVAEVVEGDETQVAMVDAGPVAEPLAQSTSGLVLHRERILSTHEPILASLETQGGLVVLEPERIAIFARTADGWQEQHHAEIHGSGTLPRDPRGILLPSSTGNGFVAWLAGATCAGSFLASSSARDWTIACHASDDPWTIISGGAPGAQSTSSGVAPALPVQLPNAQTNSLAAAEPATPTIKAFYNAARDYFTGTIVPNPAVNLPPFYSAAYLSRPVGEEELLIGGIDGKVQLLENSALAQIGGTRDWGSDFAALYSGCNENTQIVASGSGQAVSDSLRAYDLSALEAVPASEPLTMNGTVTALWTAPGGKSIMAVVRNAVNQYEVDSVSASCN
jgi:hypothetical protein